jgi:hypothetical protein
VDQQGTPVGVGDEAELAQPLLLSGILQRQVPGAERPQPQGTVDGDVEHA